MEFHWRLKAIPELAAMPRRSHNKWWQEAVAASGTAGDRLGYASAFFLILLAVGECVRHWDWNMHERLATMAAVTGLVAFAYERSFQRRCARQWLREHVPPDADAA